MNFVVKWFLISVAVVITVTSILSSTQPLTMLAFSIAVWVLVFFIVKHRQKVSSFMFTETEPLLERYKRVKAEQNIYSDSGMSTIREENSVDVKAPVLTEEEEGYLLFLTDELVNKKFDPPIKLPKFFYRSNRKPRKKKPMQVEDPYNF